MKDKKIKLILWDIYGTILIEDTRKIIKTNEDRFVFCLKKLLPKHFNISFVEKDFYKTKKIFDSIVNKFQKARKKQGPAAFAKKYARRQPGTKCKLCGQKVRRITLREGVCRECWRKRIA